MAEPEPIRGLLNVHCLGKKTYKWERIVMVIAETIRKLADQRLNGKRLPELQ
jgi:hypothetical protein